MIFEEALKLLREGKKIRHPIFEEDVYFKACYIKLKFSNDTFEDAKERGMSIVKMKGDFVHDDMGMRGSLDNINIREALNPCKHGHGPMLHLLLVMSNDWEAFD